MINEKMEKAFNTQINREYFSAYLYLSMSANMQEVGLPGFASWLRVQAQEETFHANAMFDYVLQRGGKIKLQTIETPKHQWENVLEVFQDTLAHEEQVTVWINELAEIADETKDRAATKFIQWFIGEQVEEEANANDIVSKLKLINLNGDALFAMDKELGMRVFVPPVIQ